MWLLGLPGGPVVKTLPSNTGDTGLIPTQGAKIPHALWPKNKNINNGRNTVTNLTKTIKNGPLQKNLKGKKKKKVVNPFSIPFRDRNLNLWLSPQRHGSPLSEM